MPRIPLPIGSTMMGLSRRARTTRPIPTTSLPRIASRISAGLPHRAARCNKVCRDSARRLGVRNKAVDLDRAIIFNLGRNGNGSIGNCRHRIWCFRAPCYRLLRPPRHIFHWPSTEGSRGGQNVRWLWLLIVLYRSPLWSGCSAPLARLPPARRHAPAKTGCHQPRNHAPYCGIAPALP
jgi:hypothetical protein